MRFSNWVYEVSEHKSLTKEELNDYFIKFKNVDLEYRERIIVGNMGLVVSRVYKQFRNLPYDKEELVSVGLIGLVKSVDKFELGKNNNFSTFATRCIDNEILMFIRKEKRNSFLASIEDDIIFNNFGNKKKTYLDILVDLCSDIVLDYENKEMCELLRFCVSTLQTNRKDVIMLYFGFVGQREHSQKEIADKLCISQSQVSKLLKSTISNLKKDLSRNLNIDERKVLRKNVSRR